MTDPLQTPLLGQGSKQPRDQGYSVSSLGQDLGFLLPVDSECKAVVFRPWVVRGVHMRAFHASWLSMFVSFFSTFAPAALSVTIRDDLDLTERDIAHADIAAVAGTVLSRILLGSVCDMFGPRIAHSSLMLLTSVGVFGFAVIDDPFGYILCRLIVGLSLGTFVACQYWSSVVFNVRIVGRANAAGAGAGASGGGITQLIMPLVYVMVSQICEPFVAWRLALLLPGILHILVSLLILSSTQDLPDGSFSELIKKGKMKKASTWRSWLVAMRNYRVWLSAFSYALTFGVELAIDNISTSYFFDNFSVSYTAAGVLGCFFGTFNIIARPASGILSDAISGPFGMRGRLAYLLFCQICGAAFLIFLSATKGSLLLSCLAITLTALGIEGSQAALFAIVPFVSKRSLGVVNGIVGAGGNVGATIITSSFFDQSRFDTDEGFFWTGITLIVAAAHILLFFFPMWGGILCGPTPGAEETDYYLAEYTNEEILQGKADRSIKFASEARSQRGSQSSTSFT